MAQTDVLNYIRKTPYNSNVNVVKGMLGSSGDSGLPEVTNEDNGDILTVIDGEWAKTEPGYKCTIEENTVTYFNGSLTTSLFEDFYGAQFTPTQPIDGDSITVTVNGTEYELPKAIVSVGIGYGEFDENSNPIFTNYPYAAGIADEGTYFFTSSADTYTVKIEKDITNVEVQTSECFNKARGYECFETRLTAYTGSVTTGAVSGKDYCSSGSLYFNITNNKIAVTFEGTEYILPDAVNSGASYGYGEFNYSTTDPIFTTYPCAIDYSDDAYLLLTPSAGTYSIKVENIADVVEASDCFENAVKWFGLKNVADRPNSAIIANNLVSNEASGSCSYAEGSYTKATNDNAHAEGSTTKAEGRSSHAEGNITTASGNSSHAEGDNTTASGLYSHAEGSRTTASGLSSHAEGSNTTASGSESHAEGSSTTASGDESHAEGSVTTASGRSSHAEGWQTRANHRSQHVFGEANIEDPSTAAATAKGTYIEIVGNGTSNTRRSNARTLDWSGNEELQGSLTLGKGTADETTVTAAQLKALLALLN